VHIMHTQIRASHPELRARDKEGYKKYVVKTVLESALRDFPEEAREVIKIILNSARAWNVYEITIFKQS
jgi:hypothetical protein